MWQRTLSRAVNGAYDLFYLNAVSVHDLFLWGKRGSGILESVVRQVDETVSCAESAVLFAAYIRVPWFVRLQAGKSIQKTARQSQTARRAAMRVNRRWRS